MEKITSNFNIETSEIHAGFESSRRPGFPPERASFFWATEVNSGHGFVTGRMHFPEQGLFEFKGGLETFLKELRIAGGARAVIAMDGFTWWINL